MFKSILLKSTLVAFTLGSFTASADTVIDLFSDNQARMEVEFGASDSSSVPGANILGLERDIEVSSDTFSRASAEVAFNQLIIASNSFSTSDDTFNVTVQWDGTDGSAGLDIDGLGGEDFSELEGFKVDILSSDHAGTFDVTMYDMAGQMSTITLPFIIVDSMAPQSFLVNFAFLQAVNPALDLSMVGAIELSVNGSGDTDIRVAAITAVPEPSSLAIMGLALLGFSAASRRKANK